MASCAFQRKASWVLSGLGVSRGRKVFKRSPPFCRRTLPVSSQKPFGWTLPLVQECCANIVSTGYGCEDWSESFTSVYHQTCWPRQSLARTVMLSSGLRWRRPEENCLKFSGTRSRKFECRDPMGSWRRHKGGPIAHVATG